MDHLTQLKCIVCRADSPRVSEVEIAQFAPQIPDWRMVEREAIMRLERVYKFPAYAHALAFTQNVGELAENEGHHPALLTEWGRVTVTWWTHAIKGLHRNDFIMAAKTDSIYSNSRK